MTILVAITKKLFAVSGIAIGVCILLSLIFLVEENMRGHILHRRIERRMWVQHEALTLADLRLPEQIGKDNAGSLVLAAAKELEALSKANPIASAGPRGLMSSDEPGRAVIRCQGSHFPSELELGQPAKDGKKPSYKWSQAESDLANGAVSLEKLRQALARPAAAPTVDYGNLAERFESAPWKSSRWLLTAALDAMHRHDLHAASENIAASLALAEYQRKDLRPVQQQMASTMDLFTLALIWEALQTDGWTDAQLARWQDALSGAKAMDVAVSAATVELALTPSRFAQLRQSAIARAILLRLDGHNIFDDILGDKEVEYPSEKVIWLRSTLWNTAWARQDEAHTLEHWQEFLINVRRLRDERSWTAFADRYPQEVIHPTGFARWRESFAELLGPQSERALFYHLARAETQRQMTLASVAVKRSKSRTGQVPPSLKALVPEILSVVPVDYMDGAPLRYRVTEKNRFVLYSVGTDGQDKGGDPSPMNKGKRTDFWSGRDAVWPVPKAAN